VDIGVFAFNGTYYSAPAFITWLCLDDEARTYDEKGNIVEVAYGRIDPRIEISDYNALFAALAEAQPNGAIALLKKMLKEPELAALNQLAKDYAALGISLPKLRQRQQETQAIAARAGGEAKARADEDARFISDALASAERSSREILDRKLPGYDMTARDRLMSIFSVMMDDPDFASDSAELRNTLLKSDPQRLAKFASAGQELGHSGVNLAGAKPQTLYQKIMLQKYNAQVLANVYYPGILTASFRANYVDGDISAPKSWRDVYHYDSAGRITGWTRYDGGHTTEFNWEGLVVYQQDILGRCVTGRAVMYAREGQLPNPRPRPDPRPLKMVLANQLAHYVFADPSDLRGRAIRSSKLIGTK
jgi:hypothetical protein